MERKRKVTRFRMGSNVKADESWDGPCPAVTPRQAESPFIARCLLPPFLLRRWLVPRGYCPIAFPLIISFLNRGCFLAVWSRVGSKIRKGIGADFGNYQPPPDRRSKTQKTRVGRFIVAGGRSCLPCSLGEINVFLVEYRKDCNIYSSGPMAPAH